MNDENHAQPLLSETSASASPSPVSTKDQLGDEALVAHKAGDAPPQNTSTVTSLQCSYCLDELEGEDAENPYRYEEELYCERCYVEHCEAMCDRCREIVTKDEVAMNPGELLALWEETDRLKPGYYRVLRWPIYMDGMITGFVLTANLEYILPLDKKGREAAKDAYTPGGRLCLECRTALEASVPKGAGSVQKGNEKL